MERQVFMGERKNFFDYEKLALDSGLARVAGKNHGLVVPKQFSDVLTNEDATTKAAA